MQLAKPQSREARRLGSALGHRHLTSPDIHVPSQAPPGTRSPLASRADALLQAESAAEAFALFTADMHARGFSHVFAARISNALLTELSQAPYVFISPDTPALGDYITRGFFANDPVMARARHSSRPFRWRDVHASMDDDQARTVQLFRDFGLHHGFCVPIDRARGVAGIASMGRATPFELSRDERIEIEVLSRYLFERIDALTSPDDPPLRLTRRERSVLVLVGEGKTNWEIGEILDVSEYSVRDYMRNMSEKLQTTNRTHTVVRAVQLGLIGV